MRVSAAARGSGADKNLPVVVGDGGGPKECTERGLGCSQLAEGRRGSIAVARALQWRARACHTAV